MEQWNAAHLPAPPYSSAPAGPAAAAGAGAPAADAPSTRSGSNVPAPEPTEDVPGGAEEAIRFKELGNKSFSSGDYSTARGHYTQAILLQGSNHVLWSNRSACFLALGDHWLALRDAEVCRRLAPSWAKGCYRLAVARLELRLFEDAAVAAFEGCKLDDGNKDLKALLQRAVELGREEHQRKLAKEERERERGNKMLS
jgi:tetratricopeptide (TPR) repeat protein